MESEVEFLEQYGFLLEQKGKYIANFIISKPSAELLIMQNEMYRKAGEQFADKSISFEEVATIRADVGNNIFRASVVSGNISLPEDYVYMKNWCGPIWNNNGRYT